MYKNNNHKGNFRSKLSYMDNTTWKYDGKPEGDKDVHDKLSVKAVRYLPHSTYAIKADPYEAALPTSEPYPILNRFNKIIDANYKGEDNIDGGNVQQYANSSTSLFLKIFDIIRTKVNLNYRYLPVSRTYSVVTTGTTLAANKEYWIKDVNGRMHVAISGTATQVTGGTADYEAGVTTAPANTYYTSVNNEVGRALIDEMRKSIAEAISILKSSTFTQMAINTFVIETDLPMGSAKRTNIAAAGQKPIMGYADITDVVYAMSIYYQLFLQNTVSVMNWHNSFRMKQGTMIRNAWNREVPELNGLFGLLNKAAFLNKLNSINLSFEGEYIDKNFMEQMNVLSIMPSRRANAMTEPVLELQVGWNHPTTFGVYLGDSNKQIVTDIFNDTELVFDISISGNTVTKTIWDVCDMLRDYLSMEATVKWARQLYAGGVVTTDNDRYNNIVNLFQAIAQAFVIFKPSWADYREALDVVSRPGIINWVKGFRPSITKDTDGQLFRVLVIDNIFNFLMAGPDTIDYDENTKRWRTYSKWNMYDGVAAYDVKSGGSFLSFSFKNLSGIGTPEQIEYLPQLFTYAPSGPVVAAVARDGVEVGINGGSSAVVTISNVPTLARLAPLASQNSLTIRVPTVSYDASLSTAHKSFLYKELTQIFGLCRLEVSSGTYDYALDPDILAIYQIEVTDITNMAITYARVNAPFKGTNSSDDLIGFGG